MRKYEGKKSNKGEQKTGVLIYTSTCHRGGDDGGGGGDQWCRGLILHLHVGHRENALAISRSSLKPVLIHSSQ